jgi:putative membrane protein
MQQKFWRQGLPFTALTLTLVVGACRDRGAASRNEATSRETGAVGTTANTDTSAPARSTAAGAPGAAAGSLTDANIVALLDEANKADSAAGAMAVKKGTSTDVKAFAKLMMGEHHALRMQGEQLAKQAGITPSAPANDPVAPLAQQETSTLQSTAKGAQFDKAYIDQEVAVHRAVKDLLSQSESAAENDQLKALIKKAQPVIQKHLDRAEALQKKLSPSA